MDISSLPEAEQQKLPQLQIRFQEHQAQQQLQNQQEHGSQAIDPSQYHQYYGQSAQSYGYLPYQHHPQCFDQRYAYNPSDSAQNHQLQQQYAPPGAVQPQALAAGLGSAEQQPNAYYPTVPSQSTAAKPRLNAAAAAAMATLAQLSQLSRTMGASEKVFSNPQYVGHGQMPFPARSSQYGGDGRTRRGSDPSKGGGGQGRGGSGPPFQGKGRDQGRGGSVRAPSQDKSSPKPSVVKNEAIIDDKGGPSAHAPKKEATVTVPANIPSVATSAGKVAAKRKPKQVVKCELCGIDCSSQVMLEEHMIGKRHKNNMMKVQELKNIIKPKPVIQSEQKLIEPKPAIQSEQKVVEPKSAIQGEQKLIEPKPVIQNEQKLIEPKPAIQGEQKPTVESISEVSQQHETQQNCEKNKLIEDLTVEAGGDGNQAKAEEQNSTVSQSEIPAVESSDLQMMKLEDGQINNSKGGKKRKKRNSQQHETQQNCEKNQLIEGVTVEAGGDENQAKAEEQNSTVSQSESPAVESSDLQMMKLEDGQINNSKGGKKRKKINTQGKTEDTQEAKRLKTRRPVPPKPVRIPIICDLCDLTCSNQESMNNHLSGKKHIAKLKIFERSQAVNEPTGPQVLVQTSSHPQDQQQQQHINMPQSSFPPSEAYMPPQAPHDALPAASGIDPLPQVITQTHESVATLDPGCQNAVTVIPEAQQAVQATVLPVRNCEKNKLIEDLTVEAGGDENQAKAEEQNSTVSQSESPAVKSSDLQMMKLEDGHISNSKGGKKPRWKRNTQQRETQQNCENKLIEGVIVEAGGDENQAKAEEQNSTVSQSESPAVESSDLQMLKLEGGQINNSKGGKTEDTQEAKRLKTRGPVPPKPVLIPIICDLCNVKCNEQESMNIHLSGKKHIAKLQIFERYQAVNEPTGPQVLVQTSSHPQDQQQQHINTPQSSFPPPEAYMPPQAPHDALPAASGIDPLPQVITQTHESVVTLDPGCQNAVTVIPEAQQAEQATVLSEII